MSKIEFFIFFLLVLLKEMMTRDESKISPCCFCVLRFPCVTPVVENFSSDLLQSILNCWAESHLESCKISKMELSSENNQQLKYVNHFRKKAPPQVFERSLYVKFENKVSQDHKLQNHKYDYCDLCFDYNETSPQMLSSQIFWMVVFKVFSPCKTIFKADIRPQLISFRCLYYIIWKSQKSQNSSLEEFFKKGSFKRHKKTSAPGSFFVINL